MKSALASRIAAALAGFSFVAASLAADDASWPVVGRQGIVMLVVVPTDAATDRDAYNRQIDRLCEAGQTCFINFYTNSKAVPVTVPLPDEITHEATATFRRSFKLGAQMFMWSCRLKASTDECF